MEGLGDKKSFGYVCRLPISGCQLQNTNLVFALTQNLMFSNKKSLQEIFNLSKYVYIYVHYSCSNLLLNKKNKSHSLNFSLTKYEKIVYVNDD